MDAINKIYKQALDSNIELELPSISEILLAINQELSKEVVDLAKISHLISIDIALSKSLLWLINSPQYRLPKKITDIHLAVTLLGVNKIKTAIYMPALSSSLAIKPGISEMLWKISILKAMAASKLVGFIDIVDADDAYIAGLFSRSGQLILAQKESTYQQLLQQAFNTKTSISRLETQEYAVNSQLIAFKLSEVWKVPVPIMVAILLQNINKYSSLEDCRVRGLIAILTLAEECIVNLITDDTLCELLLSSLSKQRINYALKELAVSYEYFEEIKIDIQDELLKCVDEVMGL